MAGFATEDVVQTLWVLSTSYPSPLDSRQGRYTVSTGGAEMKTIGELILTDFDATISQGEE